MTETSRIEIGNKSQLDPDFIREWVESYSKEFFTVLDSDTRSKLSNILMNQKSLYLYIEDLRKRISHIGNQDMNIKESLITYSGAIGAFMCLWAGVLALPHSAPSVLDNVVTPNRVLLGMALLSAIASCGLIMRLDRMYKEVFIPSYLKLLKGSVIEYKDLQTQYDNTITDFLWKERDKMVEEFLMSKKLEQKL